VLSSSRETTTTPGLYFLSPAPGFTDSTTSSTRKRTAPSGPRGFALTPLASNSSVSPAANKKDWVCEVPPLSTQVASRCLHTSLAQGPLRRP